MDKVVSGRQLAICAPPPASDAGIENQSKRGNSDDFFISELWRLLDTCNYTTDFSPYTIGQDARKQARIKKLKF